MYETKELSKEALEWKNSGEYLNIDGNNVFYHDQGEGPVIILIHGHPSSSYDWKEVVTLLKSKARLVSFDLVGWGLSDKPTAFSYSLMQQADIVEKLANHLNIEQAHIVSHDIGTSVHTELLSRNLEKSLSFNVLSSLFLNGSLLQWVSNEPGTMNRAQSNESLFQAMEEFQQCTGEYYFKFMENCTLGNLSESEISIREELFLYKDQTSKLAAQSGYMRERYIFRDRWIGAIQESNHVRVAWAKDDPIAVVGIGRELKKECPNIAYVEWDGIGHFPNAEDPNFVAEQIVASTGLVLD
ncbi:alpha/beta hydrolase [Photobacterium sp. BZF1]|uniref:alpha/beta fold hydrolase n=1 Tax=Photobacterium sp. BZF1 TaxID=1904457 RepID=UPI001653618D|nr:alpha/beta hydrolase [Photobacterium sp. BZF1]MBC7006149.1 alpha/beta hydrolase [Photobacterium sp. BZF1]